VALDHIEVFAATVAAGALRPANRDFLIPKYRVGTIAIKPPPVEGEAPPETAPDDKRPSAGERTTFVETLTADKLQPVFTTMPKPPAAAAPVASPSAQPATPGAEPATQTAPGAAGVTTIPEPPAAATPGAAGVAPVSQPAAAAPGGAGATPAGQPAAAAAPGAAGVEPVQVPSADALPGTPTPLPEVPGSSTAGSAAIAPVPPLPPLPNYPARLYAVRGVTKKGRPGPPSTRLELPLVAVPAPPPTATATATETSIVLTWSDPNYKPPIAYNVYKVGAVDPINPEPVAAGKFERAGVTFGTEECFTVRAIVKVANVSIGSTPSEPVCLTPRDTFPPAAPKGFSIVAGTGTMNLGWDANTEPDLAGYLVLRAEAPSDMLQPLTPVPITATSYEDKTVKPGVRYVYAIVAVDNATPPNRSAPSVRLEETAR